MSSHGANRYYPWYVQDFRASRKVQRMNHVDRGLYRELLDEQFLEGSLPSDMQALAEICGCPVKVMERAWPAIAPCFEKRGENFINLKIEKVCTDINQVRAKRAESGRLGGKAKQLLASAGKCHIRKEKKEKKTHTEPSSVARVSAEEFLSAWNTHRGSLAEATKLTAGRRQKLGKRIAEGLTLERFSQAVRVCASTPFLTGNAGRGWRADFDWLITNDNNLVKVLEGKYSGGGTPARPAEGSLAEPTEPVHEFQSRSISISDYRKGLGKEVIQ